MTEWHNLLHNINCRHWFSMGDSAFNGTDANSLVRVCRVHRVM